MRRVLLAVACMLAIAAPGSARADASIVWQVRPVVGPEGIAGQVAFEVRADCLSAVAVDVVATNVVTGSYGVVHRVALEGAGPHVYTYDGSGRRDARHVYGFLLLAADCGGAGWDAAEWTWPAFPYVAVGSP